MAKFLSKSQYDSSVYYDFTYPMIFPLIRDSIYVYRDSGYSRGNLYYRRKFLGIEDVKISIGTFQAYKWEWMTKEALLVDSIYFYDWIGVNGLLKRYVDCGRTTISDSLGTTTAILRSWDIMELIGSQDIDIDTLKPWGKQL
jgi:hypothetical protein